MLQKKRRIPKALFPSYTTTQKKATVALFSASVSFSPKVKITRVSCVVSKKVAPQAVGRNLIRRRVYSVIREFLPYLREGALIVIYAKNGSLQVSFKKTQSEIKNLLEKTGLLLEKRAS